MALASLHCQEKPHENIGPSLVHLAGDQSFKSGRSLVLGALKLARAAARQGRTIVLVEGASDQAALTTLAERYGRDLDTEGITTLAIDGAANIGHFLALLGPKGLDVELAGLCDSGEEHYFRRALERTGFGSNLTRADMETLGFYVCDADLEEELIRALGVEKVLQVVAAQGDFGRFQTFQMQPEWHERSRAAQLRRWLGTTSHRKLRYAKLFAGALDLDRVPAPLERLLAHVARVN